MKVAVLIVHNNTDVRQSKVIVRSLIPTPYAAGFQHDIELDAVAARELAATLVKAADQIDPPPPLVGPIITTAYELEGGQS